MLISAWTYIQAQRIAADGESRSSRAGYLPFWGLGCLGWEGRSADTVLSPPFAPLQHNRVPSPWRREEQELAHPKSPRNGAACGTAQLGEGMEGAGMHCGMVLKKKKAKKMLSGLLPGWGDPKSPQAAVSLGISVGCTDVLRSLSCP